MPPSPQAAFLNKSLRRNVAVAALYQASQSISISINRDYPIARLECELAGTINVTTTTPAYANWGFYNLIDNVALVLDGRDVIMKVPGRMLKHLTTLDSNSPPYVSEPSLATTGTKNFRIGFTLDCNPWAEYFSLLDASNAAGHFSLELIVTWATDAAVATGGAFTISTTATQLLATAVQVAGGVDGQPGGRKYGYPRRVLDYQTVPIVQSQRDLAVILGKRQAYTRFFFSCTNASKVPVATQFNGVSLNNGNTILQGPTRYELVQAQVKRYNLYDKTTDWDGMFSFDIADAGRLDQAQAVVTDPELKLLFDVTYNAAGDNLVLLRDRIVFPGN